MIEVLLSGDSRARLFHAFETRNIPFDTCESRLVEPDSCAFVGEIERHSLDQVHFRVSYRADDGRLLRSYGDQNEVRDPA